MGACNGPKISNKCDRGCVSSKCYNFFFESNSSHVPTIKKLQMSNHHFKVVEISFFTIRYTYKEIID